MRQTVGGAQKVATPWARSSCATRAGGIETRVVVDEHRRTGDPRGEEAAPSVLAPAWGELIAPCAHHSGCTPIQYIVLRWPTGYERWLCTTILGQARRARGEVDQRRVVAADRVLWSAVYAGAERPTRRPCRASRRVRPRRPLPLHRTQMPSVLASGILGRTWAASPSDRRSRNRTAARSTRYGSKARGRAEHDRARQDDGAELEARRASNPTARPGCRA